MRGSTDSRHYRLTIHIARQAARIIVVTGIALSGLRMACRFAMAHLQDNFPAIGMAVQRAQVENLYIEAMLLADEAHSVFAAHRDLGTAGDSAAVQIALACESLKTTTRLMHIIAWLLHRRAMFAGDPGAGPNDVAARIGDPVAADWTACAGFDPSVRRIIAASERLFERIAAIEAGWEAPRPPPPVQTLLAELQARL